MKFTYESYIGLIKKLLRGGYEFTGYSEWSKVEKSVILRHDIDMSLEKAVRMSELEKELIGRGGVYFVLLTSDFYNVHSKQSRRCIHKIIENGATIGLHFDEAQYEVSGKDQLRTLITQELDMLTDAIGEKVDVVSMHRPSEKVLSANIDIPGVINAYASCYFKSMKYLSDSRRHWREDVDGIVSLAEEPHLHILTHPFWYMDGEEKSLHHTLKEAVLDASMQYYDHLDDNFRDLSSELPRIEIETAIGKQ